MRIGAHEAAVSAALKLASLVGRTLKRSREGTRWARFAEVSAEATGDRSGIHRASVLVEQGQLKLTMGELDEAEALLKEGAAVFERGFGPEHLELASPLDGLGQLHVERAQSETEEEQVRHLERSIAYREQALELIGASYGPQHPSYAHFLRVLGSTYGDLGRYEEARDYHERSVALLAGKPQAQASAYNDYGFLESQLGHSEEALSLYGKALALRREVFGADHVATTGTMINIATVHLGEGHMKEALDLYRRVAAIRVASLEPADPEILYAYNNLGTALLWAGRYEEALAALARAREVAVLREAEGIDVALFDRKSGAALVKLGRLSEALAAADRSLRVYEAALGSDDTRVLGSILLLSQVKVLLGDVDGGVALARRAYALDGDRAQFGLGTALFAAGQRSEGLERVRSARARRVEAGTERPGAKADLAEIEAWLADNDAEFGDVAGAVEGVPQP